jgi:hypothetical protein
MISKRLLRLITSESLQVYQQHDNIKENHKNEIKTELQFEIECPRCSDIMELYSSFDSLYYFCELCDFYLYTQTREVLR